jgi:uncharacterized protein YceK
MRNLLTLVIVVLLLASCGRSVTPHDAANKHYKKCHNIR